MLRGAEIKLVNFQRNCNCSIAAHTHTHALQDHAAIALDNPQSIRTDWIGLDSYLEALGWIGLDWIDEKQHKTGLDWIG